MQKEWIVTLHNKEDLDSFYEDMETEGGALYIPGREIPVVHRRSISRNTHYMLTNEEANQLKNDPRVWDCDLVELIDLTTKPQGWSVTNQKFSKDWFTDTTDFNWGLLRHSEAANRSNWGDNGVSNVNSDLTVTASGKNVDVVIIDGHIDPGHPEFAKVGTETDYSDGALVSDSSNGAVFDRSITVRGVKCVIAGAVGGQTTVPDDWAYKTAKFITLLINPQDPLINLEHQANLIKTLKGDSGTTHAGLPTAQRVAWGGGSSYTPNFLTDSGAAQYSGYQNFLDTHVLDDMVWYRNTSGPNPPTSDRDIEELAEHLFHTIHNFGIPGAVPGSATEVPMQSLGPILQNNPSFSWTTTELHLAMKEAIDASLYDPTGYSTDWATDAEAATVAYKEYTYLVNWSMWDMSQFWDGGSLSPEWDDTLKTPAGMLANNPLGHALFKKYFEPVLSKPDFAKMQDMLQDNDAGEHYYEESANGASRINQFNWFSLTNAVTGGSNGTYTYDRSGSYTNVADEADNNHGCHCAGTVAGNTQGWARGANIYNISPYGSNPNSLSSTRMWDYIREWHNTKAINAVTGRRNPTITNNSYGSSIPVGSAADNFGNITSITYRGTEFSPGRDLTTAELRARGCYAPSLQMDIPYYFTSRQADQQDAIDDGIIIVCSAGNDSWKTVNESDQDWNNTYQVQYYGFDQTYWLNRGTGSAAGFNANINVGATSNNVNEVKATFSNCGNQVDIYAAGEAIQSSLHSGGTNDARNSSYQLGKYQGTSMSGPQVAGVVALLAESWPRITQEEAEDWLLNNATMNAMYDSGTDDAYDRNSLQGAANKYLRWINQRPIDGNTLPKQNFKTRPASGKVYPRPNIRRRG